MALAAPRRAAGWRRLNLAAVVDAVRGEDRVW
jgi:hypothetical protein